MTKEVKGNKYSIGWGILGFFIPIVGFILFLVWNKEKPNEAKASGIGALIGFIVSVFLNILLVIVMYL